jgi:hypothetical protein
MSATKKGEVIALTALFGTTRYLGAFTTSISDLGAGTEVSATGYARATCPAMTITESEVEEDPSDATNADQVAWAEGEASWGSVTHVGVFAAASGGDMIAYAELDDPKTIGVGDVLRFLAGELTFTAN